ncbi:MAG: secretin N-terminal domain-containing protein [Planctomycetota bacterium]
MTLAFAIAPLVAALAGLGQLPHATDLDRLFPPAQGPLTVAWAEGEASPPMMQLVTDYAALTGQTLSFGAETAQVLKNVRIPLTAGVTVPASEVQSFVESLLIASDFALTLDRVVEPRVVGVHSLATSSRNTIRTRAIRVTADQVEAMRQHPAILFMTAIDLPNTDVRQVSNSMRTMITDANTQQMLPAGNSSTMVLTGFGSSMAALVDLLRTIDEASAVAARAEPLIDVIRVRNAAAADLAPTVAVALNALRGMSEQGAAPMSVQGQPRQPAAPASVLADLHSNSLVVVCLPSEAEWARRLIAQLDVEVK